MTEQEKIEIIDEVEKRLEQKYKGCLSKEETQVVLKNVREKWELMWIPVAERLPEDTSKVLAAVKSVCYKGNTYIQLVWYGTNGFHIVDPDFGYLNMNRYVTHWMPLPQPPKGE